MDYSSHIPSSPILLAFLLFLFILIKITSRPKPTKNLPPSPWKLPLIGNLHQLAASGSLIHRTLAHMSHKYGPIMFLQLGQVPTIVVSSPETAMEVLKLHDANFSDRPYFLVGKIMSYNSTSILFSQNGPYWKQLRKICTTELLSASRVKSFQPIRDDEVANLVAAVSSSQGSTINLSKMIFEFMYSFTSRAAFGYKHKDQERFIVIAEETMKLAGGFSVSEFYPSVKALEVVSGMRERFERLHQESDKIIENIMNECREKNKGCENDGGEANRKGLVDVLLGLQADGNLEFPLTDDNIKAVILDIFIGGSESSSTTIEWALSEMLKTPRLMKKTQAEVRHFFDEKGHVDATSIHELTFLKAVIKETLRLRPPGPLLVPRECRESCVIDGYDIPAKARVIVNAWAIGRDPKHWTDAERFNPERFLDSSVDYKGTDFEFIPFGTGRRICPGISYSQPNIELPLANLLYHFDWKLPDGKRSEDLDMTEAFGLSVRRKDDLLLIPTLYRPSSLSS